MTQENEKGTKLLVAWAEAAWMLKADPSLGERPIVLEYEDNKRKRKMLQAEVRACEKA